jgi:hypothetical protein
LGGAARVIPCIATSFPKGFFVIALKCKMCGGDIELSDDKTYGTCEACGTVSTRPKQCTDDRTALFNRGNLLRMRGKFHEAVSLFERVVLQDETDAEAHWCMALSRHGVEYVKNHKTGEQVPIIYQAAYYMNHLGLLNKDADYLAALKHSDSQTAELYTTEAAKISGVQKSAAAILKKQEAYQYSAFICCDETDEGAKDRGDAQKIYDALSKSGHNVFYAPVTLKDKPIDEHEPHVYAALNSTPTMLVVGSSPERFAETWMKKDWLRFTYFTKLRNDQRLFTCYRGMDPGSLPEELEGFQAMDMSRGNFLRDLVNGVKRIMDNPHEASSKIKVSEDIPASRFVENAGECLKENDYRAAQKIYERMTQDHPGDYRGWWGLVVCATENLTLIKKKRESTYAWFRSAKKRAGNAAGFAAAEAAFAEYKKKADLADKYLAKDTISEVRVDGLLEYLAEAEKKSAAKETGNAANAARAEQPRDEEKKQADARVNASEPMSKINHREANVSYNNVNSFLKRMLGPSKGRTRGAPRTGRRRRLTVGEYAVGIVIVIIVIVYKLLTQ